MHKKGPIVIIDDDQDDREIIGEILQGLNCPNEVVILNDGQSALDYLSGEKVNPFLIISDINMPKMTGYQLREEIMSDEVLRRKCVPFIFFTTSGDDATISRAYECSAQGFFHKLNDYVRFGETLDNIITYWRNADTPAFPAP
ncbi:response regulator [uncultured Flavobacterium sp.]|uniref:response regulator n=1 Tax=uncultured Flavobacterium sp. TaxID=165435 RepID=UPI0025E7106D|nr:response regulator [uncultured Flavobacterium sp.]